jgi:hypothetical protein
MEMFTGGARSMQQVQTINSNGGRIAEAPRNGS